MKVHVLSPHLADALDIIDSRRGQRLRFDDLHHVEAIRIARDLYPHPCDELKCGPDCQRCNGHGLLYSVNHKDGRKYARPRKRETAPLEFSKGA